MKTKEQEGIAKIHGVLKLVKGRIESVKKLDEIQSSNGNWNHSPYMFGMANGIRLALATIEGVEPVFHNKPETFLEDVKDTIDHEETAQG